MRPLGLLPFWWLSRSAWTMSNLRLHPPRNAIWSFVGVLRNVCSLAAQCRRNHIQQFASSHGSQNCVDMLFPFVFFELDIAWENVRAFVANPVRSAQELSRILCGIVPIFVTMIIRRSHIRGCQLRSYRYTIRDFLSRFETVTNCVLNEVGNPSRPSIIGLRDNPMIVWQCLFPQYKIAWQSPQAVKWKAVVRSNMSTKEHPQDFDILWVCRDCGYGSVYHRDLEDHKLDKDHHNVAEIDLETGKTTAQYSQNNAAWCPFNFPTTMTAFVLMAQLLSCFCLEVSCSLEETGYYVTAARCLTEFATRKQALNFQS